MANAAVFTRVSTRNQELDAQYDNLLDYADQLGFDINTGGAATADSTETVAETAACDDALITEDNRDLSETRPSQYGTARFRRNRRFGGS